MALPLARYPDKPLIEEDVKRPTLAAQRFIKPQALRIPRRIRTINVPATPLGQVALKVLQRVPTNSVWFLQTFLQRFQATATVGARSIRRSLRDPDGVEFWGFRTTAPTAGQSELYLAAIGAVGQPDATSRTQAGATIATAEPLPVLPMTEGFQIVIDDTSDIDNADSLAEVYVIDEYVIPRGLAKTEVPIGLESGFMWDLAEIRKIVED